MSRQIEEWRPVIGYEGLYEVSDWGRVRSLDRWIKSSYGSKCFVKGKIRKIFTNKRGYFVVTLSKDNRELKTFTVHRLVAQAFIPNPENYPVVNHKDENKENNKISNLEWCTVQYNVTYGDAREKCIAPQRKQVVQKTLDGEIVKIWPSTMECRRNGYNQSNVSACCNGGCYRDGKWHNRYTYKGYKWEFLN